MANKAKVMDSVRRYLVKMKAMDEDIPEEMAKDVLEMTEEIKDALYEDEVLVEEEKEEVKDENEDIRKIIEECIDKYFRNASLIKDESLESLDNLEEELTKEEIKDECNEEEVTVRPEVINEDEEKVNLLREVKPEIASIKDAKKRKKISDCFARALRMSRNTADYGTIYRTVEKNSAKLRDSKVRIIDDSDFGMEIARKYNPHYKEV